MPHYRVIQERRSPIWPHTERTIERMDTQDRREAEAFYKARCAAVAASADPDAVIFGWCPPTGDRFRWTRRFVPAD